MVIELLPDVAPKHAERMKALARARAYDNVCFHRVIDGFMAQTGDVENGNMETRLQPAPRGHGRVGHPDLPAEFSKLPHDRGTIGAARSQNPNWANSQFFINFHDNHFLNGQYTVYGRVISGMEHVDAITRGEPPANPDRMITVRVAADVDVIASSRPCRLGLAAAWRLVSLRPPCRRRGPGPNLVIEVAGAANGTIVIDLLPDVAPKHVAQIIALARRAPMTAWCSTA